MFENSHFYSDRKTTSSHMRLVGQTVITTAWHKLTALVKKDGYFINSVNLNVVVKLTW